MELLVVPEIRNTADDAAAGPTVPVSLSPLTNWSLRIPKYRKRTAFGASPVHVTVAPPPRDGVPLTVQLPPPGGLYVGPPLITRGGVAVGVGVLVGVTVAVAEGVLVKPPRFVGVLVGVWV